MIREIKQYDVRCDEDGCTERPPAGPVTAFDIEDLAQTMRRWGWSFGRIPGGFRVRCRFHTEAQAAAVAPVGAFDPF